MTDRCQAKHVNFPRTEFGAGTFGGFAILFAGATNRSGGDGRIQCSTTNMFVGVDLSDRPYLKKARDSRDFVFSDFLFARPTNTPMVMAAYPVNAINADRWFLDKSDGCITEQAWNGTLALAKGFNLPLSGRSLDDPIFSISQATDMSFLKTAGVTC